MILVAMIVSLLLLLAGLALALWPGGTGTSLLRRLDVGGALVVIGLLLLCAVSLVTRAWQ